MPSALDNRGEERARAVVRHVLASFVPNAETPPLAQPVLASQPATSDFAELSFPL
jgi:hypothetical protein